MTHTEGRPTADIVGHEGDGIETEVVDELTYRLFLAPDGTIEPVTAVRVTVSEEIRDDGAEVLFEGRCDPSPEERPRWDAVNGDDRVGVRRPCLTKRNGNVVPIDVNL